MAKRETEPYAIAGGGRVSWTYWRTKAGAERAAARAAIAAEKRRARGYDFGLCSPGSIEFLDPKHFPKCPYRGLYRVCIP